MNLARSKSALLKVEKEIQELERRRATLDDAISRLRRTAFWFRGENVPSASAGPQSLTNCCRAILRGAPPTGLTAREVKANLIEVGFDLEAFQNGMSAIHTVLKRLVQQHEATASIDDGGNRRYAAKQQFVIGLSRADVEDEDFIKRLLEARSPELIVQMVQQRKSRVRQV